MNIRAIKIIARFTSSSLRLFNSNTLGCRLVSGLSFALNMTNITTVTCLAIVQYYCVSNRPKSKQFILFRKVHYLIITTWILPMITLAPAIFDVWGKFVYNAITGSCSLYDDMKNAHPLHFAYNILLLILYFAIPVCIVCYYYSKIFQIIRHARRRIVNQMARPTFSSSNKPFIVDIKIIIRLVIICLIFFICYLCISILLTLSLSGILKISLFLEYLMVFMLHADCVLIPIIFLSQDNFKSLRKCIRC